MHEPQTVVRPGKPAAITTPEFTDPVEAASWLARYRPALRQALDRHGALLLRGLPMRDPEDFAVLRDALFEQRAEYREKATPRTDYGDEVFSSTDLPPAQRIRMHNENSYTLTFPGTLLFGCLVAPEEGGATPVADVRAVLRALPPELVDRFRRAGWCLTRNYGPHLSLDWRTALAVTDREAVLGYCAANVIACEWGPDDALRTTQVRPALIRHPSTGDEVWFNHAAFWSEWSLDPEIREVLVDELGRDGLPFNTALGDGKALTESEVAALNEAYDVAVVRESWQVGDVMVVDNLLAAHGRDPFRGDRRIVVAMGDPVGLRDCSPGSLVLPAPTAALAG
ncbi:TauD/TfdA family dioxygenase [Amycolatopsis sp. NPDC088138]|uniref:TauD/TfdA family dioxygenase n=1 Tax=Amycolatopsis sp. NPDC088138 TaxID=3363938 RepID=UPI0038026A56